ncbi:predicted protein [Aspergillus terreus NIH2624]|uniref:Uncharacterized protein n=1 Tax=Aspergillus terreus (strain NIH 2624 / FGSC A1156) TaxID=341663 RepID=Q0CRV5_ASPTN|nr:uncharacterized protein ATEG_03579 [Aspergillus terreus NIH2624]EAU35381.1 predicted protein [Aspergillus terreus NIH2624]
MARLPFALFHLFIIVQVSLAFPWSKAGSMIRNSGACSYKERLSCSTPWAKGGCQSRLSVPHPPTNRNLQESQRPLIDTPFLGRVTTSSIRCNISSDDDGHVEESVSVTEHSDITDHYITFRTYQSARNDHGLFTQEALYDHIHFFNASFMISSDGMQKALISWGRVVEGASQASYIINRSGLVTGSIDDRTFTPFTAENASKATFSDGKPLPILRLSESVNKTMYDVAPRINSALKFCSPTASTMAPSSGEVQIWDEQSCSACLSDASIAFGVLTVGCAGGLVWWNPPAYLACQAAAVATLFGMRANCYSHGWCP